MAVLVHNEVPRPFEGTCQNAHASLSKSTLSHAFDASSNTGGPSHHNDALAEGLHAKIFVAR